MSDTKLSSLSHPSSLLSTGPETLPTAAAEGEGVWGDPGCCVGSTPALCTAIALGPACILWAHVRCLLQSSSQSHPP